MHVPKVYPHLSTKRVLVSELVNGAPLDTLFDGESVVPQITRNSIAERLLRLTLQEVFEFRFMQTDPNFSNYFYNPSDDIIYLLDFGAAREYPQSFTDTYFNLIEAAAEQNYDDIVKYSRDIGFLTGYESKIMETAHAEAVKTLGLAFSSQQKTYDFGKQETTKKIASLIPTMVNHRLTPPPEETYSLHRKMSGMFLVCAKLKANIDCRTIFLEVAQKYKQDKLRRP
jgi:aarF domain-containing kinase